MVGRQHLSGPYTISPSDSNEHDHQTGVNVRTKSILSRGPEDVQQEHEPGAFVSSCSAQRRRRCPMAQPCPSSGFAGEEGVVLVKERGSKDGLSKASQGIGRCGSVVGKEGCRSATRLQSFWFAGGTYGYGSPKRLRRRSSVKQWRGPIAPSNKDWHQSLRLRRAPVLISSFSIACCPVAGLPNCCDSQWNAMLAWPTMCSDL